MLKENESLDDPEIKKAIVKHGRSPPKHLGCEEVNISVKEGNLGEARHKASCLHNTKCIVTLFDKVVWEWYPDHHNFKGFADIKKFNDQDESISFVAQ